MKAEITQQTITLIFAWGLLLLLVFARLYFWRPVVVPINSRVRLEANVDNLHIGESGVRFNIENIAVFAPSYPKIVIGDRLLVEGYVDRDGRIFEPKIEIIGHKDTIAGSLWNLRQDVVARIEEILPPREATLVAGTVFGVDRISRDFRDALTKTGTIHVVVVSGQNLAIVAGVFLYLVKYLGRRASMLLAVGACLIYALLTGFEPPVIRALLMVIVGTLAIFLGRASTAIISLFVVCLVITAVWPSMIVSISFQLTFAATLGILTLGRFLVNKISIPVVGEIFAVCLGAYVFTAPVILYHFDSVSLLSPLVNMIVSEVILPVMVLGFVLSVLVFIYAPAAQLFAYLVFIPAHFFVKVVEYFAGFDRLSVRGGVGGTLYFVLALVFAAGIYIIWRGYRKGTD